MSRRITNRRALRRTFRGFGTEVELRLCPHRAHAAGGAAAVAAGVHYLRYAEARLSRFNPASEIARINRAAGRRLRVSPLTAALIGAALDAAEATNGLFDPTIEPALRAAGYAMSFERLPRSKIQPAIRPHGGVTYREVELDRESLTVRLPSGAGLDLGGIAKGWLADRTLRRLSHFGAALVDIGGDVALGSAPAPGFWAIEVAAPRDPARCLGELHVTRGGVATSGTSKRAWMTEEGPQHHIIDPRTGRAAKTDLVSVTIVAPSATAAEIAAKTALILGVEAANRAVERSRELTAVLLCADGSPVLTGRLGRRVLSWEATA
jgi:FAD:protein FMN transferase